MKNYRLKYFNARKRYRKAVNRYEEETGIKITEDNFSKIMYSECKDNSNLCWLNNNTSKYLTSAYEHFEDASDDYDIYQIRHRNRKQRKADYISRVHMYNPNDYTEEDFQTFEEFKREMWELWMKK